jgi:hypothetical protein
VWWQGFANFGIEQISVELIQFLPPRGVTRGLDHRKSDVSDLRPSKVSELGNTRVLMVHLLRIKVLAKKMDCRVKPGNDGGNRGTSAPHPFG